MTGEPEAPAPIDASVRPRRRPGDAWRWFISMRTAIHLLLLVALVAALGSLVPQLGGQPGAVAQFEAQHRLLSPWLDRLGAFDLFDTPWFAFLVLLLLTSLGACLVGRWREWGATLLAVHGRGAGTPGAGLRLWSRFGSHLFHSSIFLLVAGGVFGHWTGFTGEVNLVQGQTLVDAPGNYDLLSDGPVAPGHLGISVTVSRVSANFDAQGMPEDYSSTLRVQDGTARAEGVIRPNQRFTYRGVNFFQERFGWAPVLRVTAPDGTVVADEPVLTFGNLSESTGVLKVPDAGPPAGQLGADLTFVPDPVASGQLVLPAGPSPANPVVEVKLYRGNLGLDRPQNVFTLDRSRLTSYWTAIIAEGDSARTPDGYLVSLTGVKPWSGIQVTRDDGVPLVYASFVLLVVGLCLRAWLPDPDSWLQEKIRP